MSFCPKCRYEYKAGIVTCPDCEEQLVAVLPDPEEKKPVVEIDEDEDWVQLARLTSPEFATMIVEVLHSKNIPAVILSGSGHYGQLGQMGPSSFRAMGGGFSLMVPREHLIDADREAETIMGEDWKKYRLIDTGY